MLERSARAWSVTLFTVVQNLLEASLSYHFLIRPPMTTTCPIGYLHVTTCQLAGGGGHGGPTVTSQEVQTYEYQGVITNPIQPPSPFFHTPILTMRNS